MLMGQFNCCIWQSLYLLCNFYTIGQILIGVNGEILKKINLTSGHTESWSQCRKLILE